MRRQCRCWIVVLAPGYAGIEIPGLNIRDVPGRVESWKGCGGGRTERKPTCPTHQTASWVGTDEVGADRLVVEASVVQPASNLSPARTLEDSVTRMDVARNEWIHHRGRRRTRWLRSGRNRREWSVRHHACACGEPVDGLAPVSIAHCGHKVDGITAVVARPAAPAFVTVSVASNT